jgi:hypothetical protein
MRSRGAWNVTRCPGCNWKGKETISTSSKVSYRFILTIKNPIRSPSTWSSSSRTSSPCAGHPSHLDQCVIQDTNTPVSRLAFCSHNHRLSPALQKLTKARLFTSDCIISASKLLRGAHISLFTNPISSSTPLDLPLHFQYKHYPYVYTPLLQLPLHHTSTINTHIS